MQKKVDGRKKSFMLSAEALAALEKITNCNPGMTQTEAVEIALWTLAQNTRKENPDPKAVY